MSANRRGPASRELLLELRRLLIRELLDRLQQVQANPQPTTRRGREATAALLNVAVKTLADHGVKAEARPEKILPALRLIVAPDFDQE